MERHLGGWCLVLALGASGCTPRELAWLVPHASIGFAVRTHEGHVAGAGFVTLTTPFERPTRLPRARGPARRLRLLGGGSPCRVTEVCRWEGRARAGAIADLSEDETMGGAP